MARIDVIVARSATLCSNQRSTAVYLRRGMRIGVMVLVLGALSSRVAADDEVVEGHAAALVGAGFGLNGMGDLPGPVLEGHAGGGWRNPRWMAAGLASYAYTQNDPLLASWSITRHDIEALGVFAYRPISGRKFSVHGQLGIGAAFDRLGGSEPDASARALSASFGAGVGWGPAALTVRYVIPRPMVCTGSCYRGPTSVQLVLSVTLDLVGG
jgi:hypothetical protein